MLDFVEIIDFSLISKKSQAFVRSLHFKNKIKLVSIFEKDMKFQLKNKENEEGVLIQKEHLESREKYLKITPVEEEEMNFAWTKVWSDYLSRIFNCEVNHLRIGINEYEGRIPAITEFINSRQSSIEECSLEGVIKDMDELEWFFNNCKINNLLIITQKPESQTKPISYRFVLRYFIIHGFQDWISIDNLLSYDCQDFYFQRCPFTETDLNRFLKAWIGGSNQRMKGFHVTVQSLDLDILLDGIEWERRENTLIRTVAHRIHYSTSSAFCKNSVKSMLTKRQVKLGISVGRRLLFLHHSFPEADERDCTIRVAHIKMANRDFRFEKVTMDCNEKSVLAGVRSPKNILVYWENSIEGFIFMLDYLTELFPHMPICDLDTRELIEEDSKKVIEWVKKRDKPEVERLTVWHPSTAEDVSNILENVNITTVLRIFTTLPEDFKCDLPQDLKLFVCDCANWISRDQLLQMNYEQSDLRKTNFKNKDVSDLVNKIMNDDLPAFRVSRILIVLPSMDEIVSGINYDKFPSQLRCHLKDKKYGGGGLDVYGVYDYERADGKVVSICSEIPNIISQNFFICVWSRTEPLEL
ncbi:hypothetical protein CAEBREN_30692 [Caenorhabditis brenneri]|uniref:Sdz-33 F-box domain-containing protein n=1 Tax=Caenorhabditis brenneri TaxID=135651 RepID=G0NLX9_CAEBE|nr:hypothetical protein CAEBREN_30692 [Caenorhabditis brenneri]